MKLASGGCGLLMVVLLAMSYVLAGPMPPAGTPPAQLNEFLIAHSADQEWSWFLASGPVLVIGPWFTGVLTARLLEGNPAGRYLTAAGFSTALIAGALLGTAGIAWGLFVYLGTQLASPSLLLVLAESRHFAEGAVCFPAAGAVAAYSAASRQAQLSGWRAVAVVGALAAVLQLANGIDDFVVDGVTGPLGPLAFGAFLIWLAAVSVALTADLAWVRAGRTQAAAIVNPDVPRRQVKVGIEACGQAGRVLWIAREESLESLAQGTLESMGDEA